MLNHILIPLDGSLLAEDAITPAKQILKPNGKITLVTIVEIPLRGDFGIVSAITSEDYQTMADQRLPRAKVYLENIAANLRAEDFQVDTLAQYGDAATVIVETASACKVDAISMSTHGRSGFSRLVFGSVTGKVLSAAPCPVFVIPSTRHVPADETIRKVNHQQGQAN